MKFVNLVNVGDVHLFTFKYNSKGMSLREAYRLTSRSPLISVYVVSTSGHFLVVQHGKIIWSMKKKRNSKSWMYRKPHGIKVSRGDYRL